jgi:hypothetical protein
MMCYCNQVRMVCMGSTMGGKSMILSLALSRQSSSDRISQNVETVLRIHLMLSLWSMVDGHWKTVRKTNTGTCNCHRVT